MKCPKCGREIKEGQTFCIKCGQPLSNNMKSSAPKAQALEDKSCMANIERAIGNAVSFGALKHEIEAQQRQAINVQAREEITQIMRIQSQLKIDEARINAEWALADSRTDHDWQREKQIEAQQELRQDQFEANCEQRQIDKLRAMAEMQAQLDVSKAACESEEFEKVLAIALWRRCSKMSA